MTRTGSTSPIHSNILPKPCGNRDSVRGKKKAAKPIEKGEDRYFSIQSYIELLQGAKNKTMYVRLQNPYTVFQLDATAYPGNSGSPLYEKDSGQVVGIINKVFVKDTKENLLAKPSGISYAIPIQYGKALLAKKGFAKEE